MESSVRQKLMLRRFLTKGERLFGGINRTTDATAIVLIFLVALWIVSDVLARALFNHPLPGTMELVKTALPAVVFLTFTHTLRIGRHVRMLIFVQRLPNRSREMLDIVGSLFALLVFIMISIYVWDGAWETFLRRDYEGTQLRVPIYPTHFAVALACTMLSVQYVINMFGAIKRFR